MSCLIKSPLISLTKHRCYPSSPLLHPYDSITFQCSLRPHHGLEPPLGHAPTLASASALLHRSLPTWHSRHATCWRKTVWMTVGCLDVEDTRGGDDHGPRCDCHGARSRGFRPSTGCGSQLDTWRPTYWVIRISKTGDPGCRISICSYQYLDNWVPMLSKELNRSINCTSSNGYWYYVCNLNMVTF
jgi:hypothetical protein